MGLTSAVPDRHAAMRAANLTVTSHETDADGALLRVVRPIYAEVYAEPPYCEGAAEVDDFAAGWSNRVAKPGFRLVLAHAGHEPIGFAFGFRLRLDTGWWDGLLDPVPADQTREHDGRTFVVIELAVRASYRRQGVGGALHRALLAHRIEERVTLLVRPEAQQAQAAYASWGYQPLGRLRPAPNAPVYVAMVRDLPVPVEA